MRDEAAKFDAVCALEVIEHVPDRQRFLQTLSALVRPGGLLFITTIDRTLLSWLAAIVAAERILRILPRGTHQMAERCWDAVLDELPRRWRKSYLWGSVHAHWPALLVLPISTRPPWHIRRAGSNRGYAGEHVYPFLNELVGGWFHQDYDVAGDTLEAVISAFKKVTKPEDWAENASRHQAVAGALRR